MHPTLDTLQPGRSGVVHAVRGDSAIIQRLAEMGLVPGTPFTVIRYAPLGDPIEIRVGEYALSLRKREAAMVEVALGNGTTAKNEGRGTTVRRWRTWTRDDLCRPSSLVRVSAANDRPSERSGRSSLALLGNPNTGKTTFFNALTGLKHRVGNYPGVTVEHKEGAVRGADLTLVDLPGTYSLAAQSPDEMVSVDVLLGQQAGAPAIGGVAVIVDATNLRRNLYLVSQVLEVNLPTVLLLNMTDLARKQGIVIDAVQLGKRLGVPVIPVCAKTGEGLDRARATLTNLPARRAATSAPVFPESVQTARTQFTAELARHPMDRSVGPVEALRMLVDADGYAATRLLGQSPALHACLCALRKQFGGTSPAVLESQARYQWIGRLLDGVVTTAAQPVRSRTDQIDRLLTHKVWGSAALLAVTVMVFQSIYAWAAPLMDLIDWLFGTVGNALGRLLPAGALQSLLVDGVVGGAGSVLIFLPQIMLLFLFIAILEDCGYMARAAFLMDRLLARVGLSGKSFIPLLSSFACAVPGIMATRTIENRRDRIATILVAPLMSCSARLPVYTIMIAAFVPARTFLGGWLQLQGLTLLAMHLLGLVVAVPVIFLLKRTILAGATPPFVMELPSYKWPSARLVAWRAFDRGRAFVKRAGTIIFAMAIVVWALAYFPRPAHIAATFDAQRAAVQSATPAGDAPDSAQLAAIDHAEAGAYLRASAFGQLGHWIEPAVRPLGWDWRIGLAALASFPAREVIIAVLGTIYNLGGDTDETSTGLLAALHAATWPDGRAVFNLPVALSIMVFFALCCQCGATVATIRRETNSWGYAWFTFGYMTALAYVAAFATYRLAMWWS